MKEVYSILIDFIEDTNEIESTFKEIMKKFEKREIFKNKENIPLLLQIISKIADNHYRSPAFFDKLEIIIQYLFENETIPIPISSLTSDDFKYNKRIFLFLLQKKFIELDQAYIKSYLQLRPDKDTTFSKDSIEEFQSFYYLYSGMKEYINEEVQKEIEEEIEEIFSVDFITFKEKCQKGENDSYVCSLIREDLVEDFISYLSRSGMSHSSIIKPSIYETNSYLIFKEPTLINYAAFFGSTQIVRYLQFFKVPLISSLWLYSVHSNNGDLIHFLEENQVSTDNLFDDILNESIKCHHNDLSNYFKDKFDEQILTKDRDKSDEQTLTKTQNKFYDNFGFCIAESLNFYFFPNEIGPLICKSLNAKGFRLSQLCFSIKIITIPSSVTSIGKGAFSYCKSLTQITIPSSVSEFGISNLEEYTNETCQNIYYEEEYFLEELQDILCLDDSTVYVADLITYNGVCGVDNEFLRELFKDYNISPNEHAITIKTKIRQDGTPYSFAYIKFDDREHAIQAINELNYTKLDDLPFRLILIDEKDKKNLINNSIVIKNLDLDIETLQLHDAFANFGEIISCKIPTELDTKSSRRKYVSHGYGFVCFRHQENAKEVIISLKNVSINGKPIEIEPIIEAIYRINNDGIFEGCSSLTQFTIPSSVTSIGKSAFNGCSSLTKLIIPPYVTSISNYAFEKCSSLTEITILSSVTSIGCSAFDGCSSLREITIPSSVTSIGNYAFGECSLLTEITIPSSVTTIGEYAFSMCSSLTQITIPSSVTSIGKGAFSGCLSLAQITIPSQINIQHLGIDSSVKILHINLTE